MSGTGIRSLEWFETSGNFAGLDNIAITDAVPEPSAFILLATGLFGIGLRRLRR